MEEKAKSKVLIYIIVVLVALILILVIGGILGYRVLVEKIGEEQKDNGVYQEEIPVNEEKKVDEKIQIESDTVAKKNILVNGKVIEIKETVVIMDKMGGGVYGIKPRVEIDGTEIEGKETEKIEVIPTEDINASNIFGDITTIKGEDNKDYIMITILELSAITKFYILDENGKIIVSFEDNFHDRIKVEEEWEDYVQFEDNYIIEYERTEDSENKTVFKKWKNTIKDSELVRELLETYTEGQFETRR